MKKRLLLFLSIVVLMTSLSFSNDGSNKKETGMGYDKNDNSFYWNTLTAKAKEGVPYKFTVLGFKCSIGYINPNNKDDRGYYHIYFKPTRVSSENYPVNGVPMVFDQYRNPFYGKPNAIYDMFKEKYGTSKGAMNQIDSFFSYANRHIVINSVLGLIENDKNVGFMTVNKGEATFSGRVYFTKNEFMNDGVGWMKNTADSMDDFFNREIDFDPQPTGAPEPKITRVLPNGTHEEKDVHIFKEGEPITLSGEETYFPTQIGRKEFHWGYRKVGGSGFKLVNSSDAGTPIKNSLPVGEYEVELEASAIFFRSWDKVEMINRSDPDKKARTKIIIKANESPSIDVSITAPDKVKYELNDNVKNIQPTLTAVIDGIEHKNIKHITLRIEEGTQFKESNIVPSANLTFKHDFPIKYDKDKYVDFKGKATIHLKNGKKIESNMAIAKTYIYKNSPPVAEVPPNLPPVPVLDMPTESEIGHIFIRGGRSFDLDGWVTDYYFEVPSIGFYQSSEDENTKGRSTANVPFLYAGEYDVVLGVKDNLGATSFTSQRIKITPPVPVIRTNVKGFLKENRKVTFVANNETEFLSPVGSNYTWEIAPLTEGISQDSIKMVSSAGKEIDVLFKKMGQYLVTAKGRNSYGVEGSYSMVINVAEDMAPISKIGAVDVLYRDATSKSTVNVYDNSYSVDGDYIEKRMWFYRFDSNNDGNFDDEKWVNGKVTNDHLDRAFSFEAVNVGRYEVRAVVTETFGQETIPAFINYLDYKKTDGRRSMEVDNIKPSVSYDAYFEKKVDLAIITDYEEDKLLEMESKLNQFMHDSFDAYLNVKFEVISEKKYIGRYLHEETEGYTSVPNTETPKYVVANWYGLTEYSDHSYEVDITMKRIFPEAKTIHTQGVFPSRIKSAHAVTKIAPLGNYTPEISGVVWALENGDVYFGGTNSHANLMYNVSHSIYTTTPTKILSNVEQVSGSGTSVFFRLKNGDVYMLAYNLNQFSTSHYISAFTSTEYLNIPNLRWVTDSVEDTNGIVGFFGQHNTRYDYTTGYGKATKVKGLSNVTYIWSVGGTFVCRTSSGDWYGFGAGLESLGLINGFSDLGTELKVEDSEKGIPRHLTMGEYEDSLRYQSFANIKFSGQANAQIEYLYANGTSQLTKLENLSKMDKAIGGIKYIEPRIRKSNPPKSTKIYGKNGKVYGLSTSSNLTPKFESDRGYITSFVVENPKFSYKEVGTWDLEFKSERQGANLWATKEQINASSVPLSKYANLVKDFKPSVKSERSESSVPPSLMSEVKYQFLNDKTDMFFDYKGIAYLVNYTFTHSKPVTWIKVVGRGENAYEVTVDGYEHYYISSLSTKVLEIESNNQAGWKSYGIDPSKIGKINFREDSFKYLLYLGEKDSFRKIGPALLDTLKKNNVASRVSTESKWVDRNVDVKKEINLRHILNATPEGKLYESNAIDKMLSDILKEHEIVRSKDGGLYAIVNEDTIEFSKFYRDLEGDPKFSDKNIISHDETYFDNPMGKSYFDKKTIIQPSIKLDKVGRYELKYSAVDNPVKADERFKKYRKESDPTDLVIYAHRRPIAQYVLEWEYDYDKGYYRSTWTDTSFDYDHLDSDAKKGIRDYKLSYRKAEEGSPWISGIPNNLYPGDYELRYKVKDIEGAWSKEIFEPFTLLKDPPMTLKAKLSSEFSIDAIPASESLSIVGIESKYHRPHDIHIHLYNDKGAWVSQVGLFLNTDMENYTKIRNLYKWQNVPYVLPAHLKDGAYKMVVTARSPWAEKTVTLDFGIVTPINVKGQVPDLMKGMVATLEALTTPYAHEVHLTAFKGTAFEVEKRMVKEGDFWALELEVPSAYALDYADFEFRAYTKSGKMAMHSIRREVKGATIKAFEVKGAWSYWDGKINALGKALEKNVHRFLSYEKVTFSAIIEGDPDEVYVRLSPELEAMVYTNSKGQTYYYREQFAEDIQFPLRLGKVNEGLYEGTYILPLADSTKSWEDTRLRSPYFARLYVRKGTKTITQVIEDIDLTGNIYELIHAQPKRP